MTSDRLPFALDKLAALLIRAREEEVRLEPLPRTEMMRATRPGSDFVYVVGAHACSCPAGQRGKPCKHRAMWIHEHIGRYAEDVARQVVEREVSRQGQATG
jgi:hypothetical protein